MAQLNLHLVLPMWELTVPKSIGLVDYISAAYVAPGYAGSSNGYANDIAVVKLQDLAPSECGNLFALHQHRRNRKRRPPLWDMAWVEPGPPGLTPITEQVLSLGAGAWARTHTIFLRRRWAGPITLTSSGILTMARILKTRYLSMEVRWATVQAR